MLQNLPYLQETHFGGERRSSEIIAGPYRDGPLSERIWWTRGARPGLQALDRVAKEGRKYRWVGPTETP